MKGHLVPDPGLTRDEAMCLAGEYIEVPDFMAVEKAAQKKLHAALSTDEIAACDIGVRSFVEALRAEGIETFESCEGGEGHAFHEPTIRFHGERGEGHRALGIALGLNLPVAELRRSWPVQDGEPTGPWWEMTFSRKAE